MRLILALLAVLNFSSIQLFANDNPEPDSLSGNREIRNRSIRINTSAGVSYWYRLLKANSEKVFDNVGGIIAQVEMHYFRRNKFGIGIKGLYFRNEKSWEPPSSLRDITTIFYIGPSLIGGFESGNKKIFYHCGVSGGLVYYDDSYNNLTNVAMLTELGIEYLFSNSIHLRIGLSYFGGSVSYETIWGRSPIALSRANMLAGISYYFK